MKETRLDAKPEITIDYAKHKPLLENVRLWDWKAFHDTVSQIQPLRPYAYFDTDVDRYQISGSMRQVLLTPRELDIQQLGRCPQPVDQPSFHLHARLRNRDGGRRIASPRTACPCCSSRTRPHASTFPT